MKYKNKSTGQIVRAIQKQYIPFKDCPKWAKKSEWKLKDAIGSDWLVKGSLIWYFKDEVFRSIFEKIVDKHCVKLELAKLINYVGKQKIAELMNLFEKTDYKDTSFECERIRELKHLLGEK